MKAGDRYVDVLVNSAGRTVPVPAANLDDLTDELFDEITRVNLRGPFAVIRTLASYGIAAVARRDAPGVVVRHPDLGRRPALDPVSARRARAAGLVPAVFYGANSGAAESSMEVDTLKESSDSPAAPAASTAASTTPQGSGTDGEDPDEEFARNNFESDYNDCLNQEKKSQEN